MNVLGSPLLLPNSKMKFYMLGSKRRFINLFLMFYSFISLKMAESFKSMGAMALLFATFW